MPRGQKERFHVKNAHSHFLNSAGSDLVLHICMPGAYLAWGRKKHKNIPVRGTRGGSTTHTAFKHVFDEILDRTAVVFLFLVYRTQLCLVVMGNIDCSLVGVSTYVHTSTRINFCFFTSRFYFDGYPESLKKLRVHGQRTRGTYTPFIEALGVNYCRVRFSYFLAGLLFFSRAASFVGVPWGQRCGDDGGSWGHTIPYNPTRRTTAVTGYCRRSS